MMQGRPPAGGMVTLAFFIASVNECVILQQYLVNSRSMQPMMYLEE